MLSDPLGTLSSHVSVSGFQRLSNQLFGTRARVGLKPVGWHKGLSKGCGVGVCVEVLYPF